MRELATLSTAHEFDCHYEWAAHLPLARQAGVRPEAIDAIRSGKAPEGLTDEEGLVVRYGQELLRSHRVNEETFKDALARFGTQGVIEITALIGYYGMLGCVLNAFNVQSEHGQMAAPQQ